MDKQTNLVVERLNQRLGVQLDKGAIVLVSQLRESPNGVAFSAGCGKNRCEGNAKACELFVQYGLVTVDQASRIRLTHEGLNYFQPHLHNSSAPASEKILAALDD